MNSIKSIQNKCIDQIKKNRPIRDNCEIGSPDYHFWGGVECAMQNCLMYNDDEVDYTMKQWAENHRDEHKELQYRYDRLGNTAKEMFHIGNRVGFQMILNFHK